MPRRLLLLLAALTVFVLASVSSALAGVGAQNGVRAFTTADQARAGLTSLESPCTRQDSTGTTARSVAGFCVATEEDAGSAWDANKLNHIFGNSEHGLDDLVQSLGGESEVMDAAQASLEGTDLPSSGLFEVTRTIDGEAVTIRGAVVDGVPKIGTMFIKP